MNYLEERLKKSNITKRELSIRLGVTRQYIYQLVSGKRQLKNMPVEKIVRMANILNTPLNEFLEGIIEE